MAMRSIDGQLVRGLGQAADFTRIDWVRDQLMDLAGIDPHPGTVNLALADEPSRALWREWRALPGETIEPPDPAFCRARCYPARLAGRVPAAIVLPEVPSYPENKLELVAAVPVRGHLSLGEGERLSVELCRPLAVRAVLFDIDGTLVDSIHAYYEVARIAAEPLGLQVSVEQVRRSLATGSNFWKGVLPEDGERNEALRRTLSTHAAREWPRILREHCRVFDGLARTLDELKRAGFLLGIVSGARPEVLELLRGDGLLERFDAVLLGSDVTRRKPDPEGLLKCLARLGVEPREALYVGDTQIDIQASRAAGVHAVGVLTGAADSATLTAHWPDRLIFSHARLPAIVEAA
jgi:HAD superfamily hydrolase (TIGR01509 family)